MSKIQRENRSGVTALGRAVLATAPLFAIIVAMAVPGQVQAADSTWDGDTDGNWNTTGNWTTNALPNSSNAFFIGTTANNTINLATSVPVFQLNFSGATLGNYTFGGANFLASGSGANIRVEASVTNSPTLTWNNNYQTTTTNRATGPGGFSISTISGSNANLIVNGGLTTSGAAAQVGLNQLIDFKLSNAAAAGSTVVNGTISDSTTGTLTGITKTGGGQGVLTLNGPNTFSGQTAWNTDTGGFVLGNKSAFGTGAVRIAGVNTTNSISANTPLTGTNAIANTIDYNSATLTSTTTTAVFTVTAGSPNATFTGGAPAVGDIVFASGNTGGNAFIPYYTRVVAVSGANVTFDKNALTTGTTAAVTTQAYTASSTGVTTISGSNAIEFSGTQNLSTVYSNGGTATRTFQINNSADTTFSGTLQQLNGVAGVTKTGAGRLILSGNNTYTGATTINSGTLRLAGGAAISDSSAVTLANTAGATLDLNDSSETVASIAGGGATGGNVTLGSGTLTASGSTSTYAGVISGTGGFTRSGPGIGPGTTTLTGASTYSGTTTIVNGTIDVGANSLLTSTNGPLGNSATAIILGNALTQASNPVSGSPPNAILSVTATGVTPQNFTISRNIDSSATADVTGRNNIRYVNFTPGASGTLTVSGNWALATGTTRANGLSASQAGQTLDFTGLISGGGSGTRFRINDFGSGVGMVRLSNSGNTYASVTTVTGGTLLIAGNAGAATGVLGTNATLNLAEGGNASPDNTALTDGAFTVGKTIALQNGATTTSTWTVGGNQPAVSSFTGNITTVANANSRTLRLSQVANGTVSFGGIISANTDVAGTTSVSKIGDGTAILGSLTGNTYDGTTTVSAGTLLVNNTTGSGTGAGAVTANGGTLGGTGSIGGTVAVNAGATLAPGASIESLAVGDTTLTDATFAYEAQDTSAAGADLLDITGNLTLSGTNTLTLTKVGPATVWANDDKLTLASYTGSQSGLFTYLGSPVADDSTIVFDGLSWTFNYNDTLKGNNFATEATGNFVTITAVVPEPATLGLLALGAVGLIRRRRA